MAVQVFYTSDHELPAPLEARWLAELPVERAAWLRKLRMERQRRLSLLGLQMLKALAQELGIDGFRLADISFPMRGKPRWSQPLDFSISHSGTLVACAVTLDGRVGLDIEKPRDTSLQALTRYLSEDEREDIRAGRRSGLELWTCKEAVLKAAGSQSLGRMAEIAVGGASAEFESVRWELQPLALPSGYIGHLAVDVPQPVTVREYSSKSPEAS